MPEDLTPAELTLLGLLAEQPRHGYELDEVIAARGMREWTEIGFSSIYYLLAKLRERGLIAQAATQPGVRGRDRKVYAVTAKGLRACAVSAESAIAEVRPVFPPILVGLANQPVISPERVQGALEQRVTALAERVAAVRAAAEAAGDAPPFVHAIFDYSLRLLAAEQAWLTDYLAVYSKTPATERATAMPPTYDIKRELKQLYAPKNTTWSMADIPQQRFLAIDGQGDPNTSAEYAAAVEAVYAVAYAVKFAAKRELGRDFVVSPLEGLWWADKPEAFTAGAKSSWRWTMLICQPDWVPDDLIEQARTDALAKKRLPAIDNIRLLTLHEGPSLQLVHIGPYDDEAPKLGALHEHIDASGLVRTGKHHEIYLSDPRRTDPAKLKTILRQPVTSHTS